MACNAGAVGLIPGSGRFPGEGNDNPLQCSCLENPMDRRAWQATVQSVAESQTGLRMHMILLVHKHLLAVTEDSVLAAGCD